MRLKVFRAEDMPTALTQARAALGPEALVLSTRRIAGGIELTAGLEEEAEAPLPVEQLSPGQFHAHPSLGWHGVPGPIAERLRRGELSREIGRLLRFDGLPLQPDGPPLAVVGAPGAGKTLSIAKLATRLVLADTRPLVITADGRRAGAAEELAAYTRLLGLPLVMANHPATLVRALAHRGPAMPVLIDTAGINPFDPAQLECLSGLAAASGATMALVMAAGTDALEAAEHAGQFRSIGVRHLVVTRMDIARRLGGVCAAAVAGGMALTECGTGNTATGAMVPLTPDFLATRLASIPPVLAAGKGTENAIG